MVTWVIVAILVSGVACDGSERTLKAQVSALLEDSALLARKSELLELREELAALRYDRQLGLAAVCFAKLVSPYLRDAPHPRRTPLIRQKC
jgi:hypothetical protein